MAASRALAGVLASPAPLPRILVDAGYAVVPHPHISMYALLAR
jgi:hypothetical protein